MEQQPAKIIRNITICKDLNMIYEIPYQYTQCIRKMNLIAVHAEQTTAKYCTLLINLKQLDIITYNTYTY